MRLRAVRSVVDYGDWATSKGFVVSEGPAPYGPIDQDAHSDTSLHYLGRALDINYRTGKRWANEQEALTWLYNKTLNFKRNHFSWPLDELFFNGFGYIKEKGTRVNYPISDHDDHLHIGFTERSWRY